MKLIDRIRDLQSALKHGVEPKSIATELVDLLAQDAETISALKRPNGKSPTTDSLERRIRATGERAERIRPPNLGSALPIEIQRRRAEKTIKLLQKTLAGVSSQDNTLKNHLTQEIETLKNNMPAHSATSPLTPADITTLEATLREHDFNKEINAQAQAQAHLCIMQSPNYTAQRNAILKAYTNVSAAIKRETPLNPGELKVELDNLSSALPTPSPAETMSHNRLLELQSLIPSFNLREDVPEVATGNLKDEDIPTELFELQARCAELQAKVAKYDQLHKKASTSFLTDDAKAALQSEAKQAIKELADDMKDFNKFLRQHTHGGLRAVAPEKMKEIIKGHQKLVNQLGVSVRELEQSNQSLLKGLLSSVYKSVVHPLNVVNNFKNLYSDIDNLLENNRDARHMPTTGTNLRAGSHEITHDPNYLKKNDGSFTTTCKFSGKTTEQNRAVRKKLTGLLSSKDFKLPPNPPNSNDPTAQKFSTRQALIDTFGQRWVDDNVKNKKNGGITFTFKDSEASSVEKALSERNKAYVDWKKASGYSATLHGQTDKNQALQASLAGQPTPTTRPSALTPSAPAVDTRHPEEPSDPDPTPSSFTAS